MGLNGDFVMGHIIGRVQLAVGLLIGLAAPGMAQQLDLDRELDPSATQGCAAQVSPPAPTSRVAAGALKILPPARGTYVGAYQIPAQPTEVARFANATGKMPPLVFSFHDLFSESNYGKTPDRQFTGRMEGRRSPAPLELAGWLAERGSVLSLAWAVYCCDTDALGFWLRTTKPHDHINRILAGEHDDFFRQSARQIRDYGQPIMLTLVPEFNWQGQVLFGADGRSWMDSVDNICNQYGDPSWPDGPERVRDLFIHVIDLFREEGVTNVTWMMYAANHYMAAGRDFEGQSRWLHPRYYYPGDAYIDWVGQSVYFTSAEWADDYEAVGTFEEVFLPGYKAWRSVTNRPMMLPEFGLHAEYGADRRALWQDLFNRQLKSVPGVKAITIADSLLFRDYFEVPLLSTSVDEAGLVSQILRQDPDYQGGLRIGRR